MLNARIVSLDNLDTESLLGHNTHIQCAYTALDEKPAGEGWQAPIMTTDGRLRWQRDAVPVVPMAQPEVVTVGG